MRILHFFIVITTAFTLFGCKKTSENVFFTTITDNNQTFTLKINKPNVYLSGLSNKAVFTYGNSSEAILHFGIVDETDLSKPIQILITAKSNGNLFNGTGDLYFGALANGSANYAALYYKDGDQYNNTPAFNAFPSVTSGKISVTSVKQGVIEGIFILNLEKTSNNSITKTITGTFKLPI